MWNNYRSIITHFEDYPEPLYKELLDLNRTASELLDKVFAKVKSKLDNGVPIRLPNPD